MTMARIMIILVLGGVRSGKSRIGEEYALKLANQETDTPLYYLATARADMDDNELAARIARHQASRDKRFVTIETGDYTAKDKLAAKIADLPSPSILVIDGMGMWLAGLGRGEKWQDEIAATLAAIKHGKHAAVFISDEVGLGLLPTNPLARQFTDDLGTLNQTLAKTADSVVVCVAGIASPIKGRTP